MRCPTFLTSLVLLVSAVAVAQTVKPSPVPPMTMTQGIYVNRASLPKPRSAQNGESYYITCIDTGSGCGSVEIPNVTPGTVNTGEWRVGCRLAKFGWDDPIVHPSSPGITHLHTFFGNTATSSTPNFADFAFTGQSTCTGGTANRTGYWAPPLVYHCPAGSTNGCDRSRDGEVQIAKEGNFYYKINYSSDDVEWFPLGHRMIIGNPNATTENTDTHVQFECYTQGQNGIRVGHVPTPAEGIASSQSIGKGSVGCDEINFIMSFPDCWDGVNLDAPDHKAHMAYANAYFGCAARSKQEADANLASNLTNHDPNDPSTQWPPRYPHHFPVMIINMHTLVKNSDLAYLRLSSDPPASSGQPAGYTLHTDRVEGFSRNPTFAGSGKTLPQIIIDDCYHKGQTPAQHVDCHDDNLGQIFGDGRYFRLGKP